MTNGAGQIDEKLVIPEWVNIPLHVGEFGVFAQQAVSRLTTPLDIGYHAIPSIVMLIDLLFLSPPWTISIVPALGLSGAIAFGYWFWVEECYHRNGWYDCRSRESDKMSSNSAQVPVSDF